MAGAEKKKWLFTIFSAAFVSLLIFLSVISVFIASSTLISARQFPSLVRYGAPHPPAFAYYISGGRGHKDRIVRLLLAVYHPRNRYLLHLGSDATEEERVQLAQAVRGVVSVRAFGNVDVMGKPDAQTYMGASNVAAMLRAAAVLLRIDSGWDWFINLSAMDYPLITQDGSPWLTLSRSFLEFCVLGWDNLPRTLLMYFTNVILSQEGYFHSVICNSAEFQNKTVNADLRYVVWDNPPKMEPHFLNYTDYDQMVQSGAAFARQFQKDDAVLNMIDSRILKRGHNRATPGAWCTGRNSWWMDPCSKWGDVNVINPGPEAEKLGDSMKRLLDDWKLGLKSCK
ncbi:hypothetical protein Sjap_024898 [Stephania japonica]|uniref:Uncharacterized protein n=1 Tax=Stephania japonica TaxID=461633 RepID=A0AAP0EE70_9MAGN